MELSVSVSCTVAGTALSVHLDPAPCLEHTSDSEEVCTTVLLRTLRAVILLLLISIFVNCKR